MSPTPNRFQPHIGRRIAALHVLATLLVVSVAGAQSPDLQGHWEGEISAPGTPLQVMVDLTRDGDTWTGTIDIPMQGAKGLPLDAIEIGPDTATFRISGVPGEPTFEGKLEDGELRGNFKQGPATLPFRLGRDAVERPKRPQEPALPLPYEVSEHTYTNGDVTLAGTLTKPEGDGPFPAAVLITGSGAQDRDESLVGHKPFLVLADHLTRNGIAVLRVDDRGVGGSTGDPATATSEDYATDVLASVRYLRQQSGIDPGRVGLIGHSEGGMIAPMVAARSDEVAFCVLMAGTGVPGSEILALQQKLILEANGTPQRMVTQLNELQKEAIAVATSDASDDEIARKLRTIIEKQLEVNPQGQPEGDAREQAIQAGISQLTSPWFKFFLSFDPRTALRKTRVPVLALNGALDLQVDAEQNLPEIEKALGEAGNQDVTTVRLESLNHLFQTAQTGSPNEYQLIEETIAPVALDHMSSWILERFGNGTR